jgi:ribosomal protein S18 acetylase RimI-like enzyme
VAKSNTAAIALYERLGFERVRSLRKTLSGQYVMKKDIAMKTLS